MPANPLATPIPVARPWLPPIEVFEELARDIFERRYVSNFSKYAELLEERAGNTLGHRSLAIASCDIGMTLAWRALGLTSGEVIVPSFTFASSVNAIVWNGLTPVFADIDPVTLCVDPVAVKALISDQTVAVAGVHVFGEPVSTEVDDVARDAGLALLFDAAHGIGSVANKTTLAGRGDVSVFSLSGTKVVTAGEGGIATFADAAVEDRFRSLRGYGFLGDYNVTTPGLNGKISELEAALGYLSFDMLDEMIERRAHIADRYRDGLERHGICMQPRPDAGDSRSYKDLVVVFPDSDARHAAEAALAARNVGTKRYFLPIHTMDAYRHLATGPLPVTDDIRGRALCLPIFHDLGDDQIDAIVDLTLRAIGVQA